MFKKLLLFIFLIFSVLSITINVQAKTFQNVIEDKQEIEKLLKEKNIYEKDENVITVIQFDVPFENINKQKIQNYKFNLFGKDLLIKSNEEKDGIILESSQLNKLPSGQFKVNTKINKNWTLSNKLGLDINLFEELTGYNLSKPNEEILNYTSNKYDDDFIVKCYVNYERQYFDIYDKDLFKEDFLGEIFIQREVGYTIKIIQ